MCGMYITMEIVMIKLEKKNIDCFKKREESGIQDRLTNLINKINKKKNPDQEFFESMAEALADLLSDTTKDLVDNGSKELKRMLENLSMIDSLITYSESNEDLGTVNFFNNREYKSLEKYVNKALQIINQINQDYR